MAKRINKNKERRFKTFPSRFSEGKVHRYLWSFDVKVWYPACSDAYGEFGSYHGEFVDDETPVTCKKCDPSLRTSK